MRQALGAVLPGQQPCISWCCKPAALIRAQSAQHLLLSQTRTDCSVISSKQPRCSHQKLPQRLSHLPQWNSNAAATQQAVATELAAVSSQHRQQTGGELSLSHLGLAPLGWTGSLLVASAVRGCSLLFTALRKTQARHGRAITDSAQSCRHDVWFCCSIAAGKAGLIQNPPRLILNGRGSGRQWSRRPRVGHQTTRGQQPSCWSSRCW